jgi:site-specific DNA-cytosine methylase
MIELTREIRHVHFYCGAGGGAKGANLAKAEVGMLKGKFRCIGGIDSDAAAVRDFTRMAGAQGTVLDLFSLDQYRRFHGCEPPPGWREATRDDIHKAAGYERPHVILMSAPCKGFSGLLSEKMSQSVRYQALNELALRGLHLALDAWGDDPAEFILFENVPRIQSRGRRLLDQIESLLSHYGYASAETTHDCGELGGLAQSRKRFLLVARHVEKVPPFLYEPTKRPLRAVGRVLEQLPMPGDIGLAGPMHRIPSLQWKTWVRLAFVEAGSDWRSLSKLNVEDGYLKDFAIAHEADYHKGVLGVRRWEEPTGTLTGRSSPSTGSFAIADPRVDGHGKSVQLGVRPWESPAATVTGGMWPGQGPNSVADPRFNGEYASSQFGVTAWDESSNTITSQRSPGQGKFSVADPRMSREKPFRNVFRIVRWDEVSRAVTGGGHPTSGGIAVADPRTGYGPNSHRNKLSVVDWEGSSKTVTGATQVQGGGLSVADPRPNGKVFSGYGVTRWDDSARTIAGESFPSNGVFAVADPRSGLTRDKGDPYLSSGHYGVVPWDRTAGAVTASLKHDSGPGSVADPRLPEPNDKVTAIIRSLDDCWHRPFTTFELAALQGLIDPGERFEMDGQSDSAWRERIGNAIPAPAAQAIFGVIGTTLLLAWSGETFVLGSTPIWVRDIAVALSVARQVQ